jgi:hypothetical protein
VYDSLSRNVKHLRVKYAIRDAVMIIFYLSTADKVEEFRVEDVEDIKGGGWL